MDKNMKSTIKAIKSLRKKGLLYVEDNINLTSELNYQLIMSILENMYLTMDVNQYEKLKQDKEELVYQLALVTFNENQLVSNFGIEFTESIIIEYIDIEDPVIIDDHCVFAPKIEPMKELHKKALTQIKEKKFPNMIF